MGEGRLWGSNGVIEAYRKEPILKKIFLEFISKYLRNELIQLMPGSYTVKYIVKYNSVHEEREFTVEAKFEGPKKARRGLADPV